MISVVVSCGRSKKEEEITENIPLQDEESGPQNEKEEGKFRSEEYKLDFSTEDIGTIKEFTPEFFGKLTILYKRKSKKWIKEAQSLPPEKQAEYIERANRSFFAEFNIREQDYVDYSQKNIDELNAYMNEHPEILSLIKEY